MTIDKEQLISLLTEKTGLETGQVEDQLEELINRIKQAAEEGKTFEIEGFGEFSMDEGNLQFEPSGTLEMEINNKYAGMKPIELIGAFKAPEGDEVPDMDEQTGDEDARWIFDEAATEEESAENPVGAVDASGEEASAEDVFRQIFGEEEEETGPAHSFGDESAQPTQAVKGDDQPRKDPIGRLLVAAVVVIALGVGSWVIYDMGFLITDEVNDQQYSTSLQTPASQTGDSRLETPQESSSPKEENNVAELEEQKIVENEEGSRQKEQQPFGLRGEFDQTAGGYTIVVHSLRSVRKAENNQQDLREAGFRTLVSKAEVRGTTYYRVGIGQFETISDAQQALSEIPERYQDDNFIKRIQ